MPSSQTLDSNNPYRRAQQLFPVLLYPSFHPVNPPIFRIKSVHPILCFLRFLYPFPESFSWRHILLLYLISPNAVPGSHYEYLNIVFITHHAYVCLSNCPPYLSDILTVYTAARQFRSSSDISVHLSVQYPMVKGLLHIPPLLLGTLFLSRSALLILYLLSDPELKLTFSVLPINCLRVYPLLFVFLSPLSAVLLVEWVFFQCFVTVIMFCNGNNVFVTIFLYFVTIWL